MDLIKGVSESGFFTKADQGKKEDEDFEFGPKGEVNIRNFVKIMHVMNSNLNDMEWNVRRGILIDEDHMNLDPDPEEEHRKKNGQSHTKSSDMQ